MVKYSMANTLKLQSGRLAKPDWTEAAIATLIDQGIDAVQITRLAKALGVSRGSFYWHFEDRQALLTCMIEYWQSANGTSVKNAMTEVPSLSEGVLAFFSLWIEQTPFSAQLEQAVRDWARLDNRIAIAVRSEDNARIETISQCYARFGFKQKEALVRARVLYFAQIGYFAMHMQESMEDRNTLLELYYTSFTGRQLNKKVASKYIKKSEEFS